MEHLVLVVHGIGDALMSVDLGVVQLRSLVECCDTMRAHHEEVRQEGEASPGRGGGIVELRMHRAEIYRENRADWGAMHCALVSRFSL